MISWNKKRKTFLIIGSSVWIFFVIVLSISLYPEKRNNPKLEKKEWIDLLRKENKNHEENIAEGQGTITVKGKSLAEFLK